MGWAVRVGGWLWAHRDALVAGWRLFRALRNRRRETQKTGQSWKDYYRDRGEDVILELADAVDAKDPQRGKTQRERAR